MTDTPNLGLPFIDGGQAQKHVTHNEALRILDAAIQISVSDVTRTVPPLSPAEGARHVVAVGASGAWSGHGLAIATWQDGAWAFLAPKPGWCVWSIADDVMMVFDGTLWRAVGTPSLDSVPHLGINTEADAGNRLSVKSNAALFAAIDAAGGGSGDIRVQVSRETSADAASMVFSDAYSGRAEFGLVGDAAFKLKVSPDGAAWREAFAIDPGNAMLRLQGGVALASVIAPPPIVADAHDYAPAGLGTAAVLQMSSDAARNVSGIGGGVEGRILCVINIGGSPLALLSENAASQAANRLAGSDLAIAAGQAALLRYDGTAARWRVLGGANGSIAYAAAQMLTPFQQNQAQRNAGLAAILRGYLSGLTFSTAGAAIFGISAGVATDSSQSDVMTLGQACTKTGAAWTAGSGNGALDAGTLTASTQYHAHLIKRMDTGAVDVLVSLAPGTAAEVTISQAAPAVVSWIDHGLKPNTPVMFATSGTLPAGLVAGTRYFVRSVLGADSFTVSASQGGAVITTTSAGSGAHRALAHPVLPPSYTLFRRIFSLFTDASSNWLRVYQNGDLFLRYQPVNDYAAASPTNVSALYTLSVPTGVKVQAKFRALFGNTSVSGVQFLWHSPNEMTQTSNVPAGNGNMRADVAGTYFMCELAIETNASGQLRGVSNIGSGNSLWLVSLGWLDNRDRGS
jgi:hypothetical protein